jgi:hypothetical protein
VLGLDLKKLEIETLALWKHYPQFEAEIELSRRRGAP